MPLIQSPGLCLESCLRKAAENGHADAVEALLTANAGVDSQDNRGRTAVYFAAMNGHSTVLKALLAVGATVDSQHDSGWEGGRTPLHLASENGRSDAVRALAGSSDAVRALAGCQCRGSNSPGQSCSDATALCRTNGHVDALTALLEADAAIDIRSSRGFTPIDCAEGYGHAASARMLRSATEVESACTASSEFSPRSRGAHACANPLKPLPSPTSLQTGCAPGTSSKYWSPKPTQNIQKSAATIRNDTQTNQFYGAVTNIREF